MIKISKASKDKKAGGIVMFWSNKIAGQELSKIGCPLSKPLGDEEKEIEEGDQIRNESDGRYIIDIKQECQKLSMKEIRQKIVSELTGLVPNNLQLNDLIHDLSSLHIEDEKISMQPKPLIALKILITLLEPLLKFKFIDEDNEHDQQNSELYPSPTETLDRREKGGHLSISERWTIYKLIQIEKVEQQYIMKRFKLSYSTIRNILKEYDNESYSWRRNISKHGSKLLQSKVIQKIVKEYVIKETNPFWIDDIIKHVNKVKGVKLQYHQLRDYMKKGLHLSYKKGGNRPWNLNLKRQKHIKELFAIRLIDAMRSEKDIINIDESCFNKNTKMGYSWLNKGNNWWLANIKFQHSISLISAICTNGFAFSAVIHGTVDGVVFVKFLDKLSKEIKLQTSQDMSKFIILMDNWAIHRSKLTKHFLEDVEAKVHFNVPYAPELAPI